MYDIAGSTKIHSFYSSANTVALKNLQRGSVDKMCKCVANATNILVQRETVFLLTASLAANIPRTCQLVFDIESIA